MESYYIKPRISSSYLTVFWNLRPGTMHLRQCNTVILPPGRPLKSNQFSHIPPPPHILNQDRRVKRVLFLVTRSLNSYGREIYISLKRIVSCLFSCILDSVYRQVHTVEPRRSLRRAIGLGEYNWFVKSRFFPLEGVLPIMDYTGTKRVGISQDEV